MQEAKDFKDTLDELRRKSPAELSPENLAFMKARRTYLTVDERQAFGLDEETAPVDAAQALEPVKPSKGLTKVQLQEALTAKGIAFDEDATKVQLAALLDGVNVKDETVTNEN